MLSLKERQAARAKRLEENEAAEKVSETAIHESVQAAAARHVEESGAHEERVKVAAAVVKKVAGENPFAGKANKK